MSLFRRLFGSESVVKGAMKAADAVVFTEEERSEFWLKMMAAYEPFKLAQRLLAIIFAIPFVLINLTCAIIELVLILMGLDISVQEVIKLNNETLGEPVLWIMIFYFGGGAGEGILKGFFARRNERKKQNET